MTAPLLVHGADDAQVDGVRCEAGFVDTADGRLFTVRHLARTDPIGTVVVCSSLFAEEHTDYRRDFQLAQRLAGAGIATARFHYRGVGNSAPGAGAQSLAAFARDARSIAGVLATPRDVKSGTSRLGFVGIGPGALVAAAAAARRDGSPVVLWKPVADGERYFRDLLRARLIAATRTGQTVTTQDVLDALAAHGWADVMGFRVTATLRDSLVTARLSDLGPGDPREVLFQPFRGSRATEAARALDTWSKAGNTVTTQPTTLPEDPWFIPDAAETSGEVAALENDLIEHTWTWLRSMWSQP